MFQKASLEQEYELFLIVTICTHVKSLVYLPALAYGVFFQHFIS